MLSAWNKEAESLHNGTITKEEYDTWRYSYPKFKAEQTKAALDAHRAEKGKADLSGE